jgi:hypothetical protein
VPLDARSMGRHIEDEHRVETKVKE